MMDWLLLGLSALAGSVVAFMAVRLILDTKRRYILRNTIKAQVRSRPGTIIPIGSPAAQAQLGEPDTVGPVPLIPDGLKV